METHNLIEWSMASPKIRDSKRLWGIPLSELRGDELYYVLEEFAYKPDKTLDLLEILSPHSKAIIREYGNWGVKILDDLQTDHASWIIRELDLEYWSEASFDEVCKIAFSDNGNTLSNLFKRDTYRRRSYSLSAPPHSKSAEDMTEVYEFVWKLRSSLMFYGRAYDANWNSLVTGYYAIPDFDFGPGFEVRFDHNRPMNSWGLAFHIEQQIRDREKSLPGISWDEKQEYWRNNKLYIDGIFIYLIYYRGKHVLSIGFSLGDNEVYLGQIQVRNLKGNRWLYKIPGGYFNYTVQRMAEHFATYGIDTYLVNAKSLADRVKSLYEDEMDPDAYERIILNYDQPLDNYIRGEKIHKQKMDYHKLLPYPRYSHNPIYHRNPPLAGKHKQILLFLSTITYASKEEIRSHLRDINNKWWKDPTHFLNKLEKEGLVEKHVEQVKALTVRGSIYRTNVYFRITDAGRAIING